VLRQLFNTQHEILSSPSRTGPSHAHSLSLSLSHSHTHTLSLSLSYTHKHTHTFTHTHKHIHTQTHRNPPPMLEVVPPPLSRLRFWGSGFGVWVDMYGPLYGAQASPRECRGTSLIRKHPPPPRSTMNITTFRIQNLGFRVQGSGFRATIVWGGVCQGKSEV